MIVIHIIYISPGVVVAIIAAAEPHPPPLPTCSCTFTRKKENQIFRSNIFFYGKDKLFLNLPPIRMTWPTDDDVRPRHIHFVRTCVIDR